MDTLTKREIMDEVVANTSLDRKTAENAVELFVEIIKESLEKDDDVSLSGFGKWSVREKRARRGRNPQTGDEITIAPRKVVSFSISNVLKAALLGKK